MTKWIIALALSFSAMGCVALECTEVGCESGLTVSIGNLKAASQSYPLTVEVCVESSCHTATVDQKNSAVECSSDDTMMSCFVNEDGSVVVNVFREPEKESESVTVKVSDSLDQVVVDETKTVTYVESQPNGEGCEPTCRNGEIEVFAAVP
ncbi:MAG: hypothetical protein IPK82_16940 [Polyangiaceae bacterium]|nr:hypothetical protein [Polyangiaceae bacterium]